MSSFVLVDRFGDDGTLARGATHGTDGAAPRSNLGRRAFLADVHALAATLAPARTVDGVHDELLVLCEDRYHFAVSLCAAWERGYVVALPPNSQPETVRSLRYRPYVRTVLHDVGDVPGFDVRKVVQADAGQREAGQLETLAPLAPIASERRVVVVYTSGSTGQPLACPKTAGQLLGEACGLRDTFGIGPGDHVVASVPPHHIYGLLFGVLLPLVSGASFTRHAVLHAEAVAALVHAERATVLVSVPAHLRGLGVLEPSAWPHPPRRVFSSGAALPEATSAMIFERFGWSITEILGSSETGGIAHRVAVEHVGEPSRPFTVFDGITVTEGPGGRMQIDSPYLDPELPRPFVSSDRAAVIDARRFTHLGRVDGVVKVGGTRVSVQELEARLLAIPGVRDAAVWAVDVGGPRGHETRAVVASETRTVDELRKELLRWLDAVVVPRRMRIVESLPREANGKLRREALEQLFASERGKPSG